jgi:hypothetical protein
MMKIKPLPLGIAVLALFFGAILVSMQLNWWLTETTRVPATFKEGELAGQYNPADIRGSYSFGDINQHFNVPLDDLRMAFGVPEGVDVAQFKAKDLETIYSDLADSGYEIGTSSLRLFVALYTGTPYEPGEETYLSRAAVELLKSKADLSAEQIAYLDAHQVDISAGTAEVEKPDMAEEQVESESPSLPAEEQAEVEKPVPAEEHVEGEGSTDRLVRGPTTFQNVLDWGVSQETIETIIDGPMPITLTVIRDYCLENELDFGVIKLELQEAVDQTQ